MNNRRMHLVDKAPTPEIGGPSSGDGGPPYNGGMDARLTTLETRWDAVIPTLATKADLKDDMANLKMSVAELRADMHENNASIKSWTLATVIGLFFGFAGLYFAQANLYSKQQSAQPAPIIIQVPSQAPAK